MRRPKRHNKELTKDFQRPLSTAKAHLTVMVMMDGSAHIENVDTSIIQVSQDTVIQPKYMS